MIPMTSNNVITEEVKVDEQALEGRTAEQAEEEFEGDAETPQFRPGVEQEIAAKVDANHPEGIREEYSHLTLVEAERIKGREAELERISERARMGRQAGREERTRRVVREQCRRHRAEYEERDPRRALSRDELARVNQEADRLTERLDGPTRAAISKSLARRVRDGQDLMEAVFATLEAWRAEPGVPCAIAEVGELPGDEVTIEGEIIELWNPGSGAIEQVGLIADETSKIKFTSWVRSDPRIVQEGDRVRMRSVKVNQYRGRRSVAVTGDSRIVFPERDARWHGR